jgi:hypothetical protein
LRRLGVTLLQVAEWSVLAGAVAEAEDDLRAGLQALGSVGDRINLPFVLATGAAIAAGRGDTWARTPWGAVESVASRQPRPTTTAAIREYEPYLEAVQGAEFDRGRAHGRTLSLEDAVRYALSNLD